MKFLKNWKLALLLLITCNYAFSNSENGESEVSYSISINENDTKLATIRVSYISYDSTLIMAPGANQLPKRCNSHGSLCY